MGNDSSRLNGLVIDKNAVEANDFWTLYNAVAPTTSNEEGKQLLSIFQGEPVVSGQLWLAQGPLERAIKNLMIYRHPYILRYVTTWEQGGQKHLATARVRPLLAELSTQSDIQICLGLRSILCSLIFLIEKAMARHLNICISSIYITDDMAWRLAGFEYVWKSKEVTKNLLDLATAYRYKNAIDPCELIDNNTGSIEQFAFATLCEEILEKCSKNDTTNGTPHVNEFREYCANHLKHKNTQMRPKLSAVLLHPYFNHEFVLIHSFLFELPLKSIEEKKEFFAGLIDRLYNFNEEVVAAQLSASLLSRMVLLDPTAQLFVTPNVLICKTDYSLALFSKKTYTKYLLPHIKRMFLLRDAQIRLILLEYFMEYVRLLSEKELEEFILPHLIAGMHDTNDVLVAKTLRCLADLVPILGSTTVIGGNRSKLFSDGRPQAPLLDTTTHWVEPRSITPVMGGTVEFMVSHSPMPETIDLNSSFSSIPQIEISEESDMPARLSPDGGEDDKSTVIADGVSELPENEVDNATIFRDLNREENDIDIETASLIPNSNIPPTLPNDDDEQWSDWETDEQQRLNGDVQPMIDTKFEPTTPTITPTSSLITAISAAQTVIGNNYPSYNTLTSQTSLSDSYRTAPSTASSLQSVKPPKINDDLNALDIQVQKTTTPQHDQTSTEFDFFKDMEPVIDTKRKSIDYTIDIPTVKSKSEDEIIVDSKRFAAIPISCSNSSVATLTEGDGWGMEDGDDIWAV